MSKNDFTRKMIDLDTFTKIAYECGRFGQINCCQRLKKLPKIQYIANSGHIGYEGVHGSWHLIQHGNFFSKIKHLGTSTAKLILQ